MPLSLSDLRAAARLASGAVVGVTDVVEATHASIARPFGRPKRTRGITGFVYRMIRAGQLPTIQLGGLRSTRILTAELLRSVMALESNTATS